MLIKNEDCKKLLLSVNHLIDKESPVTADPKSKQWLTETINSLGFVQIDPIPVVEKAHYHILFARNKNFKKDWLTHSLEHDRTSFENWTHDASILPIETWPYWKHYFKRFKNFEVHKGYKNYFEPLKTKDIDHVLKFIDKEGASKPSDIPSKVIHWNDAYFSKTSLSKMAAEYLWRTGELCVSGRQSLAKVYDLAQRVVPHKFYNKSYSKEDFIDWACRKALQQLGFARPIHMAHFMDAISKETALEWSKSHSTELEEVKVEFADGTEAHSYFALENTINSLDSLPKANSKLKLLNPFDPLTRDRQRVKNIFGFDYKIEIWVPKAKRKYGYYVLPILERDKFVGRIDLKSDRKQSNLNVLGLWWEPKVRASKARTEQLMRQLKSLARFIGVKKTILN